MRADAHAHGALNRSYDDDYDDAVFYKGTNAIGGPTRKHSRGDG
jgi:hypothetical protein